MNSHFQNRISDTSSSSSSKKNIYKALDKLQRAGLNLNCGFLADFLRTT